MHAVRLAPPRPAHSSPSNLSFWFGYLVNELPFLAFYGWILAPTILAFSDLDSPGGGWWPGWPR